MNNNKKKSAQLGMPHGTANGRLRKMILFRMTQKLGSDKCFRCKKKIEKIENFSIEHKIPWLDSKDPEGLFFDLDNISFSHLKCNIINRRITTKIVQKEGKYWCWSCKKYKEKNKFSESKSYNSLRSCRKCNTLSVSKYRKKYGRKIY